MTLASAMRIRVTGIIAAAGSVAVAVVSRNARLPASRAAIDARARDVRVSVGPDTLIAPQPLSQIDDIGGVLCVGSASYACPIAPRR